MATRKSIIMEAVQAVGGATAGAFVASKVSSFVPGVNSKIVNGIIALGGAYLATSKKTKSPLIKAAGIGMAAYGGQQVLASFGIAGTAPVLLGLGKLTARERTSYPRVMNAGPFPGQEAPY